jgi:hypothetical protein
VLSAQDHALLDEVLDALDRLYDRQTTAVELRALLFATAKALTDSVFVDAVTSAESALREVVRSRLEPGEENRQALIATDQLRLLIADQP